MRRPARKSLVNYFRGYGTETENELIELYLSLDLDHDFIERCLKEAFEKEEAGLEPELDQMNFQKFERRFNKKKNALGQSPIKNQLKLLRRRSWIIFSSVAAAILIVIGFSLFKGTGFSYLPNPQVATQVNLSPTDSGQVTLTLSDGKSISLGDVNLGEKLNADGSTIEKTSSGEIAYAENPTNPRLHGSNTIRTSAGGTYRIVLPDGTKAWLNASSSLTYPVKFDADARRVQMEGEVYFEVNKVFNPSDHKRIPFFVNSGNQEIQVLGTMFNVKAYPEELLSKTTLFEGSVEIKSNTGSKVLLKPGQQAFVAQDIRVSQADLDEAMAWRNSDFVFNNKPLPEVLHELSRWYNVAADCPPEYKNILLSGMISRKQALETVLASISSTKSVTLILKERRIVVRK